MNIRLPAPLRFTVNGATTVPIEAATLGELPAQIAARYPQLAERIVADGAFGKFVNVFIDGEDARFLEASFDLRGARTVEILPAVSGGASA